MYWKYLLVTLLLAVPNNRIFISATFEYPLEEDRTRNARPSDDELIDKIVAELTSNGDRNNNIPPPDPLAKKDEVVSVDENNRNNNGINLQQQVNNNNNPDPNPNKTPNDPTSSKDPAAPVPPSPNQLDTGQDQNVVHAAPGIAASFQHHPSDEDRGSKIIEADDKKFIIIMAVAVSTGFIGLLMAGVCYYKFRKSAKAASDVEYPAYGVTGPMKERIPSPGDRKLAQSAQMYHYQHQKQQMIAMEKANGDMKHDASDDDSEEDNVEGDYTVYECPGLAPTGEMEVKNPLFRGDETPVTPGQDITGKPHDQGPSPEQGNQ